MNPSLSPRGILAGAFQTSSFETHAKAVLIATTTFLKSGENCGLLLPYMNHVFFNNKVSNVTSTFAAIEGTSRTLLAGEEINEVDREEENSSELTSAYTEDSIPWPTSGTEGSILESDRDRSRVFNTKKKPLTCSWPSESSEENILFVRLSKVATDDTATRIGSEVRGVSNQVEKKQQKEESNFLSYLDEESNFFLKILLFIARSSYRLLACCIFSVMVTLGLFFKDEMLCLCCLDVSRGQATLADLDKFAGEKKARRGFVLYEGDHAVDEASFVIEQDVEEREKETDLLYIRL